MHNEYVRYETIIIYTGQNYFSNLFAT